MGWLRIPSGQPLLLCPTNIGNGVPAGRKPPFFVNNVEASFAGRCVILLGSSHILFTLSAVWAGSYHSTIGWLLSRHFQDHNRKGKCYLAHGRLPIHDWQCTDSAV